MEITGSGIADQHSPGTTCGRPSDPRPFSTGRTQFAPAVDIDGASWGAGLAAAEEARTLPQPPCLAGHCEESGGQRGNPYPPPERVPPSFSCRLCPRGCGAERDENRGTGFCGAPSVARAARAALHLWEEPCLSGTKGSGAVFFTGCSLGCVYCQNRDISRDGGAGLPLSPDKLRRIFLRLIAQGAHNINLVTPLHHTEGILPALSEPLGVPVAINTGGYDSVETIRRWEGKAQIWLPDMKYSLPGPAARYSRAPDYPEVAKAAIKEMFNRVGPCRLGEDGLLKSGVLIRHLVLPENLENSYGVLEWIADTFRPGEVLVSLMSQYVPPLERADLPEELRRRLKPIEYKLVLRRAEKLGITQGYRQDFSSASEEFLPAFDGSGIDDAQ